jgi:hypothetical protein
MAERLSWSPDWIPTRRFTIWIRFQWKALGASRPFTISAQNKEHKLDCKAYIGFHILSYLAIMSPVLTYSAASG